MSIMDLLDDLVMGPLNLIDRIEGLVSGVRYGDMGHQFAIPRLDKGGNLSLNEAEEILKEYGVAVYGRTHDAANMYFLVKKRQAAWAEYLLLHAGAELVGPRVDGRNPGYVAEHTPGWMPTPWKAKRQPQLEAKNQADSAPPDSAPTEEGREGLIDWWNRL